MTDAPKMEHGDFCWDELMSTDPSKAAEFYSAFCGWNTNTVPMGDMGEYTLCLQGESMIAGMMAMPPMVPEGTPSNWGSYLYVDDVDALNAKATELGAQTIVPPSDIPEVGRFSMMADPTGAMFSVMGPNEAVPAKDGPMRSTTNVGDFAWHEMMTPDAEACVDFYTKLLGWEVERLPTKTPDGSEFTYIIFKNKGKHTGGVVQMNEEEQKMGIPPHWGRYIRVESADSALEKAVELGGEKVHDAFDIPEWGRISFVKDPTGAVFGVFQGLDGH